MGRLVLDAILEGDKGFAGEDQVALFQDVVGVELGDRRDLDPFDVAGARVHDRIVFGKAQQYRSPVESAPPGLGLVIVAGLGLGLGVGVAQIGAANGAEDLDDLSCFALVQ